MNIRELPNDAIGDANPEASRAAVVVDYTVPSGNAEFAKSVVAKSLKMKCNDKVAMNWLAYSKLLSGEPGRKKVAGKPQANSHRTDIDPRRFDTSAGHVCAES
jgi:hypothetical protein